MKTNTSKINLDENTSELLARLATLTGITVSDIIDRVMSAHLSDFHELLALADTHHELRDPVANLLISFGPDSIMTGIKRIAPTEYRTLGERFEASIDEVMQTAQRAH